MNKKAIAILPMIGVTFWSLMVLINSVHREPWRYFIAWVAFSGLLTLTGLFIRKILISRNATTKP